MNKLRLILFENCNRSCEGCCNKDWNIKKLPIITSYANFDLIMLTGGEPLLNPDILFNTITNIQKVSSVTIIVYTAMFHKIELFKKVLQAVDGITLTLHKQSDVKDFMYLCNQLSIVDINNKSMRLNIFKGITIDNIPDCWNVKNNIKWIKKCPLPEGEVLMRL